MADDVNANIRVNLDTSQALAGLQSLQSRISSFNQSVIQSNAQAVAAQRGLLNNFQAQIGASRQFSTSITNVESSVGRLQTAIDKNRLSMGQYFRYGVASSKNFGKVFRQENEQITRLATERVKKLQTQYISLGESQQGMTRAMKVRPLQLFNADSAVAIQRSQIFNKLLQDGSTSLVNWGKNTQWAGRQLMVGFSVPLSIFGGIAAKTFMELEEQAISFRKVYGDIFTTDQEVEENLAAVRELTQEMTKYGIAAAETFELANVAAQSGARGADLMAQTRQATRLAVLGQMEQQEAVKTTITLQNAFQLSNEDLADSINFLNIVENQSVLSLQDVAGAIPRVAPVIKSLGGDVRDLSVMLVAMREGGVSAAEGANALKTSLARLISPTSGASKMAKEMGINLDGIVEANQGDILGAVMQLAESMKELDALSGQRLLSEIFGKRQYARVGALFNNITNEASQAQRVLDLTTMSTADLAATADKELGAVEQSISTKFTAAVELLKTEIAPIGEQFLKLATPVVEAVGKILAKFNDLSPTVKNFVAILTAGVGVVVPIVLMLVGLFGNLLGNLAKGVATLSGFFTRLRNGGEAVEYLAGNQLDAAAAAASLEGQVTGLTGSLNIQREAVDSLTRAYNQYVAGANAAAASLPQGFRAPTTAPTQAFAKGGMVGGTGNSDNQPALLMPGEFVMNREATEQFLPILDSMNRGSIEGFAEGSRASRQSGAASRKFKSGAFVLRGLGANIGAGGAGTGILTSILTVSANDIADVTSLYVSEIAKAAKVSVTAINSEIKNWQQQNMAYLEQFNRELAVAIESGNFAEQQRLLDQVSQKFVTDMERAGGPVSQFAAQAERQFPELSADLEKTQSIIRNTNLNLRDASQASQFFEDNMQETALMSKLSKPGSFQTQARVASGVLPFFGPDISRTGVPGQFIDPRARATAGNVSSFGIARSQSKLLYGVGTSAEHVMKTPQQLAKEAKTIATVASQAAGEAVVQEMEEAAVRAGKAIGPAVMRGANAASPPPWSTQLGIWIGEGIERGAVTALEDVNAQIRSQFGGQPFGGMVSGPVSPVSVNPFAGTPTGPTSPLVGGMPMAPQSVQNNLIKATQSTTSSIKNAGNQASQTAQRFSKLRGGITKFGGSLKNGSMKMQGAFFALDGLVFAASMVNGSLGDMAQKALPVVFGLQGLTMVLPMLANPIGLAAVAVGGLIAGIIALNNAKNEARKRTIEYAIAAQGSAKAFSEFAKELGGIRPSEAFAQIASGVTTKEQQETFTRGQEFIQSESGQSMMGRIEMLSGQERVNAIITELTQSIGLGIIDSAMAKGVAQAIAVELKSPMLGFALVSGISNYVKDTRGQTRNIVQSLTESISQDLDSVLTQYQDTFAQEARLRELTTRQAEGTLEPGEMEELIDLTDQAQSAQDDWKQSSVSAAQAIGPLLNASQKLADAQALINLKYREGSLDVEEYKEQTQMIEEQNQRVADALAELMQKAPAEFMGNLETTALALGIPQETVDAVRTQVESITSLLIDQFGIAKEEAGLAASAIAAALTSGTLDPGTAGSISALLGDTQYRSVVELVIEGQPEKLPEVLNLINKLEELPEPYKTEILMELGINEDNPEEFLNGILNNLDQFAVYSTYFADNPVLGAQAFEGLREGVFTTEQVSNAEKLFNELNSSKQVSDIFDFSNVDLDTLIKSEKTWESLSKKKNITAILKADDNFSNVMKDFEVSYQQLNSLPDIVKRAILLKLDVQAELDLKVQDTLNADIFSGGATSGAAMQQSAGLQELRNLLQSVTDGFDDGGEDSGGGGGGEESFLEGLLSTFKANTKLFNTAEGAGKKYIAARGKFFGMLEQLRKEGIPEGIIAMIGTGAKGVENAKELLNATAKERRELLRLYGSVVAGEAADEIRVQTSEALIERDALRNIQGGGLSQNLQEFIMANEKLTLAFAGVKKGSKEYKELVKLAEELLGIEKERDELAKSTSEKLQEQSRNLDASRQIVLDSIDLQIDKNRNELYEEFAQNMGTTPEMLQHTIDMRKNEIEQLERQVEVYDDIIEAEQERIDAIQREIDGYERQISLIERQNEMDERGIETLNRQDELRSRVADALNRELQQMSDAEQKIRDSYQTRIDALDKVAEINDYIINQQRQQMDLSRAIADGDIYAATAAVQEMRATSAGFAAQQVRAGLEGGMENQIAGLRTSGGLTREQAEERIRSIEEQSYQTSLKIRDIEDRIYARNQQIIPLKDEIYRLNENIYVIEQEIVKQESLKTDFLNSQIEPLRWANEAQERLLRDLEYEVDETNGPLAARRDHMQRHFDIATRQENLNHKLWEQTEAIANGTLKAANRAGALADNYGRAAREALAAAAAIASVAGGAPVNAYAGGMIEEYGMGGKIKKYRGGGIVSGMQSLSYGGSVLGSGGRDSVPAMLMPGEFVVRKAMVNKYGEGLMKDINMGSFAMPSYNTGAEMEAPVIQSNNMVSNINAPVYNTYDMKFSINGANQSADEIANTVMFKMRQLQNQGVRTNRGY